MAKAGSQSRRFFNEHSLKEVSSAREFYLRLRGQFSSNENFQKAWALLMTLPANDDHWNQLADNYEDAFAADRGTTQAKMDARKERKAIKNRFAARAKYNEENKLYRYGSVKREPQDPETEAEMWIVVDDARVHGCSNDQCADLVGIKRGSFHSLLRARLSEQRADVVADAALDAMDRKVQEHRKRKAHDSTAPAASKRPRHRSSSPKRRAPAKQSSESEDSESTPSLKKTLSDLNSGQQRKRPAPAATTEPESPTPSSAAASNDGGPSDNQVARWRKAFKRAMNTCEVKDLNKLIQMFVKSRKARKQQYCDNGGDPELLPLLSQPPLYPPSSDADIANFIRGCKSASSIVRDLINAARSYLARYDEWIKEVDEL